MAEDKAVYSGTGKRKTSVARVRLTPGQGTVTCNGRTIEDYFPRSTRPHARALARWCWRASNEHFDVIVRLHGGGVTGQAGALRHGIARALCEADPNAARRAQEGGLPDARRARGRAQEGRLQEGAPPPAVLQALAPARCPGTSSARTAFADSRTTTSRPISRCRSAAPSCGSRRERGVDRPRVVVGRDTRRSGPMLEDALCAGVASAGGVALRAGVDADARRSPGSCAIAAPTSARSSRPATTRIPDNGIKFFGGDGFKLTDAEEQRVEALLTRGVRPAHRLRRRHERGARRRRRGLRRRTSRRWSTATCRGLRVVVDCANGAASALAGAAARAARRRGTT